MAHHKYKEICYVDCTDESHKEDDINLWIKGDSFSNDNPIIRDYRKFNDYTKKWELVGKMYQFQLTQGDYAKYGDSVFGKDDYFADKIEIIVSNSFSNVPGAKISYPSDKYNNVEVKETDLLKANSLLEAQNIKTVIEKYNSNLNLEKIKYDSSLNLARTKEAILNNQLLKKQNEELITSNNVAIKQNELLSEANKIQEKISKKETTFKNTANITNTFDKEFAEVLGNKISDSIKPILEQQNKTLESINNILKTQDTYYKNLTAKTVNFEGKDYSPQEIENFKNVEQLKGSKDENSFNMEDIVDFIEDIFSDGFDLDYNPFEVILNKLKDEFTEDFKEKKTKYNIKSVGEI